jgi:hypothetical protein
MKDVNDWLQDYGNNFIFIYGGNDTWSASAVNLSEKTNSIKMVLKNGSHRTRIKDFTGRQKDLIYNKLEKWLDQSITNKKKAGN